MDCIEAIALKPSLRREISMKSMSNHFDDVYYCCSTVEDFAIDDLLDFSNGDFNEQEELVRGRENDYVDHFVKYSSDFDDFDMVPASEFSLPIDDLENLEWVSRVVNDSGLEFPHLPAGGSYQPGSGKIRCKPGLKQGLSLRLLCFPSTIPAKPRTKRSKQAGRVWSLESPSLSESVSSPTRSELSSPTSCLNFGKSVHYTKNLLYKAEKPLVKKQKKNSVLTLVETGPQQFQRRCSHCQVQKTPQWRTGPLGAKTLCNACGVRFKSGRLYPEYRPACSPTFLRNIHSNSHRKVLEMRARQGNQ